MFGADMGKTIMYGIIVSIPVIVIAGPLYSKTIRNIKATPLKEFVNTRSLNDEETPGIRISLITTLLPVLLIGISSASALVLPEPSTAGTILKFTGDPVIAMLISVLVAIYFLGIARGKKINGIMDSLVRSVSSITMIFLIIAGAGGFKQVLVDSGTSDNIAVLFSHFAISPLLLAWIIAAILRICVGSATVAGLTTAGIVLPLATGGTVNKELLVLAIGAGSLIFSHVNDGVSKILF
jgi:Gnt-I system high-affinity gluconate transporter